MRIIRSGAALAAVLAFGACARPSAPPVGTAGASGQVLLSIVGTNDLHGGVFQRGDRGGLALLSGYVANLRAARARDGGGVLLVDAGDMFQGTLESNLNEGAAVVAAYNALGYHAAAIGNHEFDFGPVGEASTAKSPGEDPRSALKARARDASFPLLAANLIDDATGRPVQWPNVRPSTMVTIAGVRVGIVGALTAKALSATVAANTIGLSVAPLGAAIEREARVLRADGAVVVVVTAHAGGRCTDFANPTDLSSCEPEDEIVQVIRALPRGTIDVMIAGHLHEGMGHQIEGVAVSEAYAGGRAFGRVDLLVDRGSGRVVEKRSFAPRDLCARVTAGTATCDAAGAGDARVPAEYEGSPVVSDAMVAKLLEPAILAASKQKAAEIGVTLPAPVRRAALGGESPVGNLFTDAFLAAVPGADVAVNNTTGGLRADLPAGRLTFGDIFEVMPFDNRVVAFHLTGAQLREVVRVRLGLAAAVPGIAGVRLRAMCQAGKLSIVLQRPNGVEVRDDERLLVATSDFLATGGDAIFSPVLPPEPGFRIVQDAGTVREVIIDTLRKREGRLREEQFVDRENPRWMAPGPRPVTCAR